ncbi:hypothetical protein AGABI1DRAFT_106643 [Agaricus bisporus var. burnettii JB137-S8]|uniref:WKF domain-containing protein n=1 Tax=Agaricus bisporus var. burnettii (strain JB137-S8 / ATCC MYA-4627 / FGSC 10392) TaxID=597362 RepID=K5WY80_AGABU|nr:uncharacterized protein AGABI1DRAFT_106643 [Agaricus bisporus var. burnettii JB137-S8]EKM80471.1 hypothetical protein AGABI1DRAFT_106643 [Agaricus bisporus var. burnettii JB137-S8]
MTSVINDDKHLRKKSKNRNEMQEKNKKHQDKEEGDASINESEKETRKKEKKGKKNKSEAQKDDVVVVEEDAVTPKREKKNRKRNIEMNDDEADTITLPKKKKRKTRKADEQESNDSKERIESKSAEGDEKETPKTTRKKSKKSRKNKTGFVDPEQDKETDLPEQASKALSYAFRRFHEPNNWKFNKAKQNWLVRNLWNFQSIPEKYENLVVKYLSAVQGNTRENILKICKDTLNQNTTSEASEASEIPDKSVSAGGPIIDTPTPSNNDDQKKARAQALLEALTSESAS